ncbi:MAG: trans-2-enoyl-CoA reductase family protein [Ruminococcus sp.]|jgi:enoyl-[acyl-carrier protein] reductase/trans-2-enoyl-CoA reductase (NAD+)|nr:trans-2-enoyl-CoA reductase family protein [Ruminococcus sp.]
MEIKPKIRGFICTTASKEGCTENVKNQVEYVKKQPAIEGGPKKVLVIGSSMGYGLSSRIAAAFGMGAQTIGVIYDKPELGNKTATAGWYNNEAFEAEAKEAGIYAKTVNGDAFSIDTKELVIDLIKKDWGKCDCVIYSLASPRRTTDDGITYSSVLKTIGSEYTNKSLDLSKAYSDGVVNVTKVTVEPATEKEIHDTVKVMGGEDWQDWIELLVKEDAIEPQAVTIAYSYIGQELTHPLYKDGTIGKAKEHLVAVSKSLENKYDALSAFVSVNKALVTQSSSAIPVVPLYISALYKVMKEKGIHEGTIEQMYRMFAKKIFGEIIDTDENGLIRMDDLELRPDVQGEVAAIWEMVNSDNVRELCDVEGYMSDFLNIFGFDLI